MTSKDLDFIDYFFQKEGDTYISLLSQTKQSYDDKCERFLKTAGEDLQNNYKAFKSQLLDVRKIVPIIDNVQESFDFTQLINSVFEDLEVDIEENLDIIRKYNDFMNNSSVHWKGLDIDPQSVVELGVQMMATLESMVYPIFMKLTDYIGNLADSSGSTKRNNNSPTVMRDRLHILVEALSQQLCKIGESSVTTLGRLPVITQNQLDTDSARLGAQGRYAKNCIAWAIKAVSPVLLYYFLQQPSKNRRPSIVEEKESEVPVGADPNAEEQYKGKLDNESTADEDYQGNDDNEPSEQNQIPEQNLNSERGAMDDSPKSNGEYQPRRKSASRDDDVYKDQSNVQDDQPRRKSTAQDDDQPRRKSITRGDEPSVRKSNAANDQTRRKSNAQDDSQPRRQSMSKNDEQPMRKSNDGSDQPSQKNSPQNNDQPLRKSNAGNDQPVRKSYAEEEPSQKSYSQDEDPPKRKISYKNNDQPMRKSYDGNDQPRRKSNAQDTDQPRRKSNAGNLQPEEQGYAEDEDQPRRKSIVKNDDQPRRKSIAEVQQTRRTSIVEGDQPRRKSNAQGDQPMRKSNAQNDDQLRRQNYVEEDQPVGKGNFHENDQPRRKCNAEDYKPRRNSYVLDDDQPRRGSKDRYGDQSKPRRDYFDTCDNDPNTRTTSNRKSQPMRSGFEADNEPKNKKLEMSKYDDNDTSNGQNGLDCDDYDRPRIRRQQDDDCFDAPRQRDNLDEDCNCNGRPRHRNNRCDEFNDRSRSRSRRNRDEDCFEPSQNQNNRDDDCNDFPKNRKNPYDETLDQPRQRDNRNDDCNDRSRSRKRQDDESLDIPKRGSNRVDEFQDGPRSRNNQDDECMDPPKQRSNRDDDCTERSRSRQNRNRDDECLDQQRQKLSREDDCNNRSRSRSRNQNPCCDQQRQRQDDCSEYDDYNGVSNRPQNPTNKPNQRSVCVEPLSATKAQQKDWADTDEAAEEISKPEPPPMEENMEEMAQDMAPTTMTAEQSVQVEVDQTEILDVVLQVQEQENVTEEPMPVNQPESNQQLESVQIVEEFIPKNDDPEESSRLKEMERIAEEKAKVKEARAESKSKRRKKKREADESQERPSSKSKGRSRSKNREVKEAAAAVKLGAEENDFPIPDENHRTSSDFVDHFFAKKGLTLIAALAEMKRKFEGRCKETLSSVDSSVQKESKKFMAEVHDVRKVEPVTKEIEVKDYNFAENFERELKGLSSNKFDSVKEELVLLHKYNEYTRGLIRHWEYCISHKKIVDPETVVDGGTQLMATTMSLTYPIFIKIGEFLGKLTKTAKTMLHKHPPHHLTEIFHKLVEINAIQIAAIGMSCIHELAKLPNMDKETLRLHSANIAIEAKFAKNSISWAMKAISPALLLYFIRGHAPHPPTEEQTKPNKSIPKSTGRSKPGETQVEEPKTHHRNSSKTPKSEDQAKNNVRNSNEPDIGGTALTEAMSRHSKRQHDFVDYFFQKDGEALLAELTKIKKDYEQLCNSSLPSAGPDVKKKTRQFLSTVHEARTIDPGKRRMEVADYNFGEAISSVLMFLDVENIDDDVNALVKYFEFTKNMVAHWRFRISKKQELESDAVVETGVQMMAATVSLAYPIFIKLGAFFGAMSKDPSKLKQFRSKSMHKPDKVADRFHKLVEAVTVQMYAIGKSCNVTLHKLPSKDSYQVANERLTVQTKYANNSITWAIKSLGPLLLYYFIQYDTV